MLRGDRIFNKGSLLPSIIDLEEELKEMENKSVKLAEDRIQKAKISAEKLIDDLTKEVQVLENEGRIKLLEEVDSTVIELKNTHEQKLHELEQSIERNRKQALDFILKSIIPRWDGKYPD
ncbi:hypothetical protein ACFL1R_01020 [Candidatus Latescibacterota bacterium]